MVGDPPHSTLTSSERCAGMPGSGFGSFLFSERFPGLPVISLRCVGFGGGRALTVFLFAACGYHHARVSYRHTVLFAAAALFTATAARNELMPKPTAVIDDLSREAPLATIGTRWQVVTDQVMGGVSRGALSREIVAARPAMRMRGEVSLGNNGGFVQMALDLDTDGEAIDASQWLGIELEVFGTGEAYSAHLRTLDLTRPWQSYRQGFLAPPNWQMIRLPFSGFSPHRTDIPLDLRRLKRLGLVAIGRAFAADLSIGGLRFFA